MHNQYKIVKVAHRAEKTALPVTCFNDRFLFEEKVLPKIADTNLFEIGNRLQGNCHA